MRGREFTTAGYGGRHARSAATAIVVLLAGCDGRFSADLATDPPADPQINQVQISLLGLELRRSDGATATLEFSAGEPVDLLDLTQGDPMRLFTGEQLPAGQYTGVRLLFDEGMDATVVSTNGDVFPVLLSDGAFAQVDFTVQDDESSSELLTIMLDLRQSLRFDDVDDEYTLTPLLRTVRTGDAALVQGAVSTTCPAGTSLILGGAVYAFAGADVTADDLDGATPEPYATTGVVLNSDSGQFSYALRFLRAGDYTLALTCRGNEDELGADDELEFGDGVNVTIQADDVLQRNLS
jgi:Domain of unknown function (DUF4382)